MQLNELFNIPGNKKRKKRVGRGIGSGKGKTSGRGVKGQKSRSGVAIKGFEGGQMPMIARLPKRGFNCPSSVSYIILNLDDISRLADLTLISPGDTIDKNLLKKCGLIKNSNKMVKLLGFGELGAKFHFKLDAYSNSAKVVIEKLGGSIC